MPSLNKVSPSQNKGQTIETLALNYLLTQNTELLFRNFRCRTGEIDLIILHKNQLVFLEVRFRKTDLFGSAAASVTLGKQKKILKAARFFLYTHPKFKNYSCRFDVIAVTLSTNDVEAYSIDWIQNAFN